MVDLEHSSVTYILASILLRAVTVCCLDIKCTGPVSMMMNPEREHDLKSSRVTGKHSVLGHSGLEGPSWRLHILQVWGLVI